MSYGAPELLGYRLLERLQESRGLVPKTVFHKVWSLSDRHASEEHGVEIGVPRYWYKYGEIVDEGSVDDGFFVSPSAPWGGQAYKPVYDHDSGEFDVTDRERRVVDETVAWALERFGDRAAQELEEYQYERYAPNEFVDSYSELRALLQYTDLDQQAPLTLFDPARPDAEGELVERYLDEMVATFPDDEPVFEPLSDVFLRWEDTARLLVEQGYDYARLEEFLDGFVHVVSETVLRLQFTSGIDEDRVAEWRSERDRRIDQFASTLRDRRRDLLRDREQSGVLRSVSETYDDAIRSNTSLVGVVDLSAD